MPRTPLRTLALLGALLMLGLTTGLAAAQQTSSQQAPAQHADVHAVLEHITAAANGIKDATFTVTGDLVDSDGTKIPLDIDIEAIPPQHLAKAYINEPAALADNQIVLDGKVVKNYTFLTNQITIFDANDPDALGGLLPTTQGGLNGGNGQSAKNGQGAQSAQASPTLTFDLGKIFQGFDPTIKKVERTGKTETYVLDFANKDPKATIQHVEATVPASDWLPRKLVFQNAAGQVVADIQVKDLKLGVHLDPKKVAYLPQDAQVIDNRKH